MNILLILPKDRIYYYKGFLRNSLVYAPLTLTTLAALVPKELNADIDIVDEGVQKLKFTRKHYDIVGITCVTSTCKRAYELSAYYKSKGSYTVLGGIYPTLMPDEAAKHADTVIVGMAEKEWPRFLKDFSEGIPKSLYVHKQDCCETLDCPTPLRNLQPKGLYMPIPTVIANRGCRNSCKFCTIKSIYRSKSLTKSIDKVIEEIKALKSKKILFLDPSPSSNREYAISLFKALIPLKIKWMGLSTSDVVYDDELFNLMAQSGCVGVLVGFETLVQENNSIYSKKINNVEKYREIVKKFHDNKISVLGHFIVGGDYDTKESLSNMLDLIDELGIDLPRFTILTPFPGTQFYKEMEKENRIITTDTDLYDTEHVVFKPKNMTPDELQRIYLKIKKEAYSYKRILARSKNTNHNKFLTLVSNIGFRFIQNNNVILAILCNLGLKIYSWFIR